MIPFHVYQTAWSYSRLGSTAHLWTKIHVAIGRVRIDQHCRCQPRASGVVKHANYVQPTCLITAVKKAIFCDTAFRSSSLLFLRCWITFNWRLHISCSQFSFLVLWAQFYFCTDVCWIAFVSALWLERVWQLLIRMKVGADVTMPCHACRTQRKGDVSRWPSYLGGKKVQTIIFSYPTTGWLGD